MDVVLGIRTTELVLIERCPLFRVSFQRGPVVCTLVLSGINNLKSVRFFKLVLRYDYSIVIYIFPAYWHTQCNV